MTALENITVICSNNRDIFVFFLTSVKGDILLQKWARGKKRTWVMFSVLLEQLEKNSTCPERLQLYNCCVKVWACVSALSCECVWCVYDCRCACIGEFVCVSCVLKGSSRTWLMLWTRLRDFVSVALRPPQTHAGTHTTTFSLSYPFFFLHYPSLSLLSQIKHDFFYQAEFLLTQLQCSGYLSIMCWVIAVYCIFYSPPSLCLCHLKQPQWAQYHTIDCALSLCPLPFLLYYMK